MRWMQQEQHSVLGQKFMSYIEEVKLNFQQEQKKYIMQRRSIIFDLLTNPTEILADENGWVKGIKCVKMELGEPDASGRRKPVEIEGSEFVMDLDAVIMSLGTSPNPLISSTTKGLEINKRKCIVAEEENGQTSKEGVLCRWRCCNRCCYSYSCHGCW